MESMDMAWCGIMDETAQSTRKRQGFQRVTSGKSCARCESSMEETGINSLAVHRFPSAIKQEFGQQRCDVRHSTTRAPGGPRGLPESGSTESQAREIEAPVG
jgi:hypothetical protein